MAKLAEVRGDREWVVETESVLGRSARCSLRIAKPYVSIQHASLRWTGAQWELRDLGSRNGTWLDGRRLGAGEAAFLVEGGVIAIGHPDERWLCRDAGPPQVVFVNLTTGEQLVDEDGVLGMPSANDPLATALRQPDGRWLLEAADGQLSELESGCTVEVGGDAWRFSSPEPALATATSASTTELSSQLALHFRVSRDEEYVELELESGREVSSLGSWSQNHLLLTLARARLKDAEDGLPPTACGWTYKEDLVSRKDSPQRVDLDVFRLRRHFARRAPQLAGRLIERRPRTRQLRIGVDVLRISWL